MKKSIWKNQKGFTLIEVLIAIGILATMVIMMSSTMGQVFFSKNSSSKRSMLNHSLYISLNKIYDDINMAFQTATAFEGKDKSQLTGLVGTKESINFATLSGIHYIKNYHDSNQIQVGYYLAPQENENYTLMRRQTDFLTEDLEAGGKSFPLLNNIKSLLLTYYDSQKKEWVNQWDTGSVSAGGRLPALVKLQMQIAYRADEDLPYEELDYELVVPIKMYKKLNF